MTGFALSKEDATSAKTKAEAWAKRLDAILAMDLPFHKSGLAHLTCTLIAQTEQEYREVLRCIPTEEMERLFTRAAKLGVGIELNQNDMEQIVGDGAEIVLRP
ncbi:MAG: hypothetical protein IJ009_05515 [Clostridia bacterium]|nr:hypothetical protein [Clostridia bacterium]